MGAVRAVRTISQAEYLQTERLAPTKSEYLAGRVIAMAGASYAHNRLSTNIAANLHLALRNKPCVVLGSDMRVKIAEVNAYFYPDVVIVCGQPQFEDEQKDNLLNPTLREYLLVAQDRTHLEHFICQPDGQWSCRVYDQPEQSVAFLGGAVSLPLQAIYEGIFFSQEA